MKFTNFFGAFLNLPRTSSPTFKCALLVRHSIHGLICPSRINVTQEHGFGRRLKSAKVVSSDDPFISLVKEGTEQLQLAIKEGGFLVDVFPWLKYVPKWFPGAGFQTIAEHGAKLSHDMRVLPYLHARDKFYSGPVTPSFVSHEIGERLEAANDGKLSESDEEIISAASGICFSAGADTTLWQESVQERTSQTMP